MTHEEKAQVSAAEAGSDGAQDAARQARFGKLPERVRPEDTVEERPAVAPDPARDTYNADEWLIRNVG
ncbi:hypothetical protein [Streptomyces aureoverticillatus]|uniref:hypothetical protein n=1 Tax=Streptomyces aureoverticillatus TaxID=66871 RepID=UPI0013DB2192|nr:hypothetical protein [Streptomyces aureoverticillatus]QIB44581.1 hypothetical protein G3H79_17335 [Streptomyces aureoverticillatus]